jgi:hypothetical protein
VDVLCFEGVVMFWGLTRDFAEEIADNVLQVIGKYRDIAWSSLRDRE